SGSGTALACDSYTWQGTTYTSSGTYTKTLTNAAGCDSTATLILTINNSTSGSGSASSCDSYTWQGTTYTVSGTYTKKLTNAAGCDSTATLTLTINNSSSGSGSASSCDSYTWQGTIYTSSGTYTKTLTNAAGCDSTATLSLAITPSSTQTTNASACDTYTWSVNGSTYTQSGTYYSTSGCHTEQLDLIIQSGCGGIVLDLTVILEGYYTGSGTMQPVLLNQGVTGATGSETDTIVVELRDAADPSLMIESQKMLLMTDGTASTLFSSAAAGDSCYIVLLHRNSMQTWSANPVVLGANTSYDFSSSASQAFGDNQKEVETGVWAIFTADINQDGFVDAYDYPIFEIDLISFGSGYLITDLNGDGFVDAYDYPLYEINSINFVMGLFP
ncbi:MAG: hypothetical protein RL021_1710, partial [Bacteroidota bacterium]